MDFGTDALTQLATLASPSQHARLLQLQGLDPSLVVERLEGREAVCAPFLFSIDCLSVQQDLDLTRWPGQQVTLQLRQDDGAQRRWHGLVTAAAQLGGDGGLVRYRLTVEPWTALLQRRRNALIFQDLDARAICERVFADYSTAHYRFDVQAALPARALTTQYRETDWEFVTRLLAESGLAWRYEHAQGEDDATHTLVIFDPQAEPSDAGRLRFHRSDIAEATDTVTAFGEQRQLVPNHSSVASWQREQLRAVAAQQSVDDGELPALEVYVVPHEGRFAQDDWASQEAQARLDALRLAQTLYPGAGSVRRLGAGQCFALSQHAQYTDDRFVVLAIEHDARNNLDPGIAALLGDSALEHGSYRNRFTAVPASTPLRPLPRPRPQAGGPQTARVVGHPDAAVSPNREHQVRIQFPWQRGQRPHPGGLAETAAHGGHAPDDASSGTWVPVAEWIAGPNWGSHFLPRIGAEVLVEFAHGDLDRPQVTGQLFNGEVSPPFGGGVESADNHPGTLSGLRSQGHDGSGVQQWLIDDTPGQLRNRLHTDLADSRLELGYLLHGADATRGALRGQGFELGSAGWGNLHAAQGLLLSASARRNAGSTQLDSQEAVAQLKGAERTQDALHDTLQAQQVPGLAQRSQLTALREALDPQVDGKYSGNIGGQATTKPAAGARDGGDPVERFADARVLAESPEQIAWTTANSAISYAGGTLSLTVQQDLHAVAGRTLASSVGQHAALFAQAGPIRAIAAAGPLSLQAHAGELEVLADQSVTVTASDEEVVVLAKNKVVLQAGQTRVTLEGGDITFACPGEFRVKAGQHPFLGGESGDANLALPDGLVHLEPDRMLDFSG